MNTASQSRRCVPISRACPPRLTNPWRLESPPQTVLAALGPKMLELAGERADGAHPYNVPPEHTREAREILGPNKLLCVEQGSDPGD